MWNLGRRRHVWRATASIGVAFALLAAMAAPASAAQGQIDHVETDVGAIRVLYSIPGIGTEVSPELNSLTVTVDGDPVEAEAQLAADANSTVRRTAVLAIDVSNSMQGQRFEQAKLAAKEFLETAPVDVFVGIVTFAGTVEVVQEPTLDRDASGEVVDSLTLSNGTFLYDGVVEAVRTAGDTGQRSVLVMSDGADTSTTQLEDVTSAVRDSEVSVDVVALAQSDRNEARLEQIAGAGGGSVLSAADPESLTNLFATEAEALARQILIIAQPPAERSATEGTLEVSISADGERYTDSAFVTIHATETAKPTSPTKLAPAPGPPFVISRELMLGGLAAAALGVMLLLAAAFGVFTRRRTQSVEDRVGAYSRKAGARKIAHDAARSGSNTHGMGSSAVGFAQRALATNKGLEASLGARLEAAAISMKPAEWLLVHAGIAFGAALLALLLSSGSLVVTAVGLLFGMITPWVYLGFRKSRRTKAFSSQLADTMQLMAGSLSAGLSLAQSVDTVVREGSDPMSGELKRALIEARLGVNIEDALEAVGLRMQSKDFQWVVMAIRIQREVGGNLAELLTNVATTIREREYLHRQVQALSAEGRLSTWILGGLPPVFVAYLAIANPGYLEPLVTTLIGWIMCGVMITLLTVGIFWMKKLVKVEV